MTLMKDSEFDGSYANAGREVSFNLFSIIFGLILLGLLVISIVAGVKYLVDVLN